MKGVVRKLGSDKVVIGEESCNRDWSELPCSTERPGPAVLPERVEQGLPSLKISLFIESEKVDLVEMYDAYILIVKVQD
jgi:hypothetical protein